MWWSLEWRTSAARCCAVVGKGFKWTNKVSVVETSFHIGVVSRGMRSLRNADASRSETLRLPLRGPPLVLIVDHSALDANHSRTNQRPAYGYSELYCRAAMSAPVAQEGEHELVTRRS